MRSIIYTFTILVTYSINAQITTNELKVEETSGVTHILGNVGIGTQTPSTPLEVIGDITANYPGNNRKIFIYPGSGAIESSNTQLMFNRYNSNNVSFAAGGGNVAIGNITPTEKLHVDGNIKAANPNADIIYYRFLQAPESNLHLDPASGHDLFLNFFNGNNIRFGRNGDKMFIDISGNVGIGTTSPSEKLQVNGNIMAANPNANIIYYRFLRAPQSNLHLDPAPGHDLFLNFYSGNNVRFGQNGDKMFIASGGNVGIGTTAPSAKLHVNGNIKANPTHITWPDFVFLKNYSLSPLEDVERYINEFGHLKGIPSAQEVQDLGVDLVNLDAKLLQKIEELTLYLISQNKRNKELQSRVQKLENELKSLQIEFQDKG